MQQQLNPELQQAVTDFREFATERWVKLSKNPLAFALLEFDGQRFEVELVQLAFEAFQHQAETAAPQLFASIREDSKYHHQIDWCIHNGHGHPFPVVFRAAMDGYVLAGGAGGAYRMADVDLHVLHEGELYRVAEGGKGK